MQVLSDQLASRLLLSSILLAEAAGIVIGRAAGCTESCVRGYFVAAKKPATSQCFNDRALSLPRGKPATVSVTADLGHRGIISIVFRHRRRCFPEPACQGERALLHDDKLSVASP